MTKTTSYIVAVLACIGIVIIYALIGALLGWKHGGGILPMIILFGAITATWKGIIGLSKKKILKRKRKMLKIKTITPHNTQ